MRSPSEKRFFRKSEVSETWTIDIQLQRDDHPSRLSDIPSMVRPC